MTDMTSDQPPNLLAGRYELGELLGSGGMAEVRKATDARLSRIVAVKRLRSDLASDPTFQARFRREAQSSAKLNHRSIVSVYDTGEERTPDSDVVQPYIVMEYVKGRTLRDILKEGRKILPERALEIGRDVLDALDYSHRAGIVHRDIKPGNVMLNQTGEVKVMDFGIARAVSDSAASMTQTAAVVGTAQYLSPEQARGETVDSRSDVYSAGCLLYELLTGVPPFSGDSPVAIAYQHVREPAPAPSSKRAELPPAVDSIVLKSLAKRVEDRYQSAAEMRADIDAVLDGQPVNVPPPPPAHTMVAPAVPEPGPDATGTQPAVAPVEEEPRKRRTGLTILMTLLVLALLVGGFFIFKDLFAPTNSEVSVPEVVGDTQQSATATLAEEGFDVAVEEDASADVKKGIVISQDPSGYAYVEKNSTVTIVVSTGAPETDVKDVIGLSKDDAQSLLEGQNLKVKFKERDSDEAKDEVVATQPVQGSTVREGSTVTVFFSDGPETVPEVVGKPRDKAVAEIEKAGFEVKVIEVNDETDAKTDTVTDQTPSGGTEATAKDTTVVITVTVYEEPDPTPSESASSSPSGSPSPSE